MATFPRTGNSIVDRALYALAELIAARGVPSGTLLAYGGSTAPNGYLLCDGSAISRTDYPALFEVFGTTFGAGDGSTTFNLPDYQGKTFLGVSGSYALGSTGGAATVALTSSQVPSLSSAATQSGTGVNRVTGYSGSGSAHENLPPYVAANVIVKV